MKFPRFGAFEQGYRGRGFAELICLKHRNSLSI